MLQSGVRLGPYEIEAPIGQGGMGVVYRARDTRLGRTVAVKVLPAEVAADPESRARFEREARAVARLDHPSICVIHDVGREGSIDFIVMQYLEGETLALRLNRGPLGAAEALSIAGPLADALGTAHRLGLVHRDVKPGNVMLTPTGAKLLDFGLARSSSHQPDPSVATVGQSLMVSEPGTIVGTYPYMSPEQVQGKAVDSRSDLFSFGALLFEMLSGRRAFEGATFGSVAGAILHTEPPAVTSLVPNAPPALDGIVGRCLEKDPGRRWQSAVDLAAALRDVASTLTDRSSGPHPVGEPAGARKSRGPWIVGALAVSSVALALVVGRQYLATRSPDSALTPASVFADVASLAALKPEQMTVSKGFDGFLVFAPDGHSVAYSSDRSGAFEIYVQGRASGSTPVGLTRGGRHSVQPAWSPDGQYVAYHEMAGDGIWVVPSRGGAARKVSSFGSRPVWSPDGRTIAFQSAPIVDLNSAGGSSPGSTIWIVGVEGSLDPTPLTKPGEPAGGHAQPAWWPAGRKIVFSTGDRRSAPSKISLWSIELTSGALEQLSDDPKLSTEFAVLPDGSGILFGAAGTSAIWLLPVSETGQPSAPQPTGLPGTGMSLQHLAVSNDGRRVSWTSGVSGGAIWAVNVDRPGAESAGLPTPIVDDVGWRAGYPSPSSDGRLAFIGNRGNAGNDLYVLDRDGPRRVPTDDVSHGSPVWLEGNKEIAALANHGEGAGLWAVNPDTGRERLLFPLKALPAPPGQKEARPLAGGGGSIGITPTLSKLAAAFSIGGSANVWVVPLGPRGPTGAFVQRTFEKESGSYPAWSPDERWLAYQCAEGGATNICVTGADAGDRLQLTDAFGQSFIGGWAGNDTILFAARRDASWSVASVSRIDRVVHRLAGWTEPRFYVRYPRWDADNRRVVFERFETTGRIWSVELPRY